MSCPIHTVKRHPRICRFCRADTRENATPIADTEAGAKATGDEAMSAFWHRYEQRARGRIAARTAARREEQLRCEDCQEPIQGHGAVKLCPACKVGRQGRNNLVRMRRERGSRAQS